MRVIFIQRVYLLEDKFGKRRNSITVHDNLAVNEIRDSIFQQCSVQNQNKTKQKAVIDMDVCVGV